MNRAREARLSVSSPWENVLVLRLARNNLSQDARSLQLLHHEQPCEVSTVIRISISKLEKVTNIGRQKAEELLYERENSLQRKSLT